MKIVAFWLKVVLAAWPPFASSLKLSLLDFFRTASRLAAVLYTDEAVPVRPDKGAQQALF